MNILPKKRWHVRNRENIARVRRDEAEAAQKEKDREERIKLAEREARRKLLLEKSGKSISQNVDSQSTSAGTKQSHINFFQELEDGTAEFNKSNIAHDKEVKEEREKYEKQIGYLTYLGQDTNEALGKKNWYDVVPERSNSNIEINLKSKAREDPLEMMKRYTTIGKLIDKSESKSAKLMEYKQILDKINYSGKHKINYSGKRKREYNSNSDSDRISRHKKSNKAKRKLHKKNPSSEESTTEDSEDEIKLAKQKMLEKLRIERLNREKEERRKTEELLATLKGRNNAKDIDKINFRPKYNSQFNPQLAKQNYDR